MATKKSISPVYADLVGCQAAVFEWAESFDTKDWERLAECVSPTLYIDYRTVMGDEVGAFWESMPAEQFVTMVSNPHFLGNKRIKTQHGIGASKWVQTGDDTITGYHQMRVAHQRYKDDELKEVQHQGHAYGKATIHYRKVEDTWKFAGLEPDIRWSEFEYSKIFGE